MSLMSQRCARGTLPTSRTCRMFSARELLRNGLLSPNTSRTDKLCRFVERHAGEPLAETAKRLEMREWRLYEEVERKKVLSADGLLGRGRTCPVGQRMRLLNKLAAELALPEVFPGLADLDESVC